MRHNNIEFRWSETNESFELVRWQESGSSCYVIAFFSCDTEGYYMKTVGDRFFEDPDAWLVGKHAMRFLNDIFDQEATAI